jgi:hypothetical protein
MGISNCYDGTGNLLNLPGEPGEGGVMAEEFGFFEWSPEMWAGELRDYIMGENPNRIAILAAFELAVWMPVIPDWVMALANGNPDEWDDVIQVVRDLIRYDEKREAK